MWLDTDDNKFYVNSDGTTWTTLPYSLSTHNHDGTYLKLSAGGTVAGATTFSAAGTAVAITNNSTIGGTLDVTGAITGASYGGITEANLLDKSDTETVSGDYTFSGTTTVGALAGTIVVQSGASIDLNGLSQALKGTNTTASTALIDLTTSSGNSSRAIDISVENTGGAGIGLYATSTANAGNCISIANASNASAGIYVTPSAAGNGIEVYPSSSGIGMLIQNSAAATSPCLKLTHSNDRSHINFTGDPAPASPSDGDFWFDGTNLKLTVGSTTYTLDKTAV